MKRNLFALAAVVFAITLSSFTTSTRATYFLSYKGTGNYYLAASYDVLSSASRVSGTGKFNWVSLEDANGIISDTQVEDAIDAEDLQPGGSTHPLDNELADSPALDIKTP
ncbi:hypothetical protein [Chitinophaga deserti]|uniref:hypothetical protein n=1 Tax=Chitinophaga deserti TaxID=2164099 RepID=UPI000D6CD94F|nr:hypothetical protein [Chitinophaga deserti]